jgi:hypothetical protein
LFLAHNGGVAPDHVGERTVDSEWALEVISQSGGLAGALPRLKERTKSALNLLLLRVGRGAGTPASLQYVHYFKPAAPDQAAYYRMYVGVLPGGRAVVSSTLTLPEAGIPALRDLQPADYDAPTILA